MIHLVTWLPLQYQRTLCRTLAEAYGQAFMAWFAERADKEFPFSPDPHDLFVHHYLAEVGYGKFVSELRSDPAAVVILCGWSSPMTNRTLLLSALSGIPVFIWADHPHPRQRSLPKKLVRKIFLNLLARKVSGFLACGKPTVEHLISLGIPASKITNFPYWVDLPNDWAVPERCLAEDSTRQPLRLLGIGRHVSVKQFEVAIDAVALANARAGTVVAELVLVGDGPERSNLEAHSQLVASSASVRFTGWLDGEEILGRVRASDALVLTSRFDAFGVAVLEAMASGRAVLASAGVMAARDRDEGTGAVMIHPVGDAERLAEQITSLASDRELLRQASVSSRATAEKWPPARAVAILDQLLQKTKRGRVLLGHRQSIEQDCGSGAQRVRLDRESLARQAVRTSGR